MPARPKHLSPAPSFVLVALSLAGCIPQVEPPASPPPTQAVPPPASTGPTDDECGAGDVGAYLNQLPTSDTMEKIRATVGKRTIRTIHPGDAVTMDFVPYRLNIELGADGRIKRFHCG